MELGLYIAFTNVLCILRKFLNSFDVESMHEHEQRLIKKSKKIFLYVSVNIVVLMFTNSMFGLLSPFLWISDVFYSDKTLTYVFISAVQLFYTTNMLFALVMLYAMHHFAHYEHNSNDGNDDPRSRDDRDNSVDDVNFNLMFQQRNNSFTSRETKSGPHAGDGFLPTSYQNQGLDTSLP